MTLQLVFVLFVLPVVLAAVLGILIAHLVENADVATVLMFCVGLLYVPWRWALDPAQKWGSGDIAGIVVAVFLCIVICVLSAVTMKQRLLKGR
ncbi:MAG: hypothetical protein V4474_04350 [Patescibacteria group bacterium]